MSAVPDDVQDRATITKLDGTTVSSHADDIAEELPEPQQHAIDQAQREQGDDVAASGGAMDVDALGIPWNPQIHSTGKDGKGVKTAKGTWRKKRGIAGSASQLNTGAAPASDAGAAAPSQPAGPSQHEIACRRGGMMAARLQVQLSVGIGGEVFIPRLLKGPGGIDINEMEMLEQSWGDYFVAKGVEDLPPGWALFGAMAMYYLPRLNTPQVRERAGGFIGWIKAKYASWRLRRKGVNVKPDTATENQREATGS